MGIKVSQMPSTNTLTDNDLIMVVQDNENKKINKKDLQNNLTDPSLTKRVEELEKENAYLNNLVEQAFDKKEVEGEELSINDTIEAKMNVSLYGNTKQNGEPTPDTPVEIQRVTGNNKVVVSNKNLWGEEEHGTIDESTGIDIYNSNRWRTKGYIKVNSNTSYTLSSDASNNIYYIFYYYNKDKTFIKSEALIGKTSATSTSPSNCEYLRCVIADTVSIKTTQRQIEQGDTATSYVPHKEQVYELDLGNIELCKIGNYQDYFYNNNNKWYKREVIGSVTLDGLNWTAEKISNDIYRMISTKSIFKGENEVSKISELFCNIYKKGSANTTYLKQTGINLYKNFIYVYDSNYNTSTSVDSFKTMLKEKNAILYGILPEPRDIEITDTTLISQLEALKKAMSYTEQTNISQINNDIPFILKVTALASYNSRIVALENAILNANRSTQTENARKSNEIIEETKKEVIDK